MGSKNKIIVKQTKSSIGKHKSHRATLLGLGLKKINSRNLGRYPVRAWNDNKVSYMVEVVSEDN